MALFKKKDALDARKNLDRTSQLLSDYKRITEVFKVHPCISIKEVFGAPPEKYHLLYKVDGLEKNKNAMEVKKEHVVEIALPPDYPSAPPVCKRVTTIFHPNISEEGIDIKKYWRPDLTLADLIVLIGQMITFQKYDTDTPLSPEAAKWAARNAEMLPLSTVDLAYKEPQRTQDKAPPTEVLFRDAEPAASQVMQDDGRKTEGIFIDAGTDQISIKAETAEISPPPTAADFNKTAVLQEVPGDTAVIVPTPEFEEPPPKPAQPKPVPKKQSIPQVRPSPSATPSRPPMEKETEYSVPVVSRPEDSGALRRSGSAPAGDGIVCPRCGNRNPAVSNFCLNCGAKIRSDSASPGCPIAKVLLLAFLISLPVAVIAVGMTLIITRHAPKPAAQASKTVQSVQEPPAATVSTPAAAPAAAAATPPEDSSAVKATRNDTTAATQKPTRSGTLSPEKKQARIDEALKNAQLYLNLGSFDEAMNQYMIVLKYDPNNDDALDGLRAVRDAKDKAAADSARNKK
jgi:ubiquitin-protein ligase